MEIAMADDAWLETMVAVLSGKLDEIHRIRALRSFR
jgi:hypothetical protein